MEYDFRKLLLWKLHNATKGSAQSILMDKKMSDEERKRQFDIIEEVLQYVDNYDTNVQKLADYNRMKTEYDKWQRDLIDDGR